MSGIFGVVRLGTDVPDLEACASMASAMARWAEHAPTTVTMSGAAFGHALRLETPEDQHSSMPACVPGEDLLFTAEGRLANRSDVVASLGMTAAEAEGIADSTLVLRAYRKWGDDCCRRMVGDWSFAAWHPGEQRLVLARDHLGNTALYFHFDERRGFAHFASDPRALHAAGVPRRLNEVHLAMGLISCSGTDPEHTIDLDVLRVRPAHVVRISPVGQRSTCFWQPPDREESPAGDFIEYTERLRVTLDEATVAACRSVGPLATTLSGGLDSGSVTVLAGQHVPPGDMTAYTAVPIVDTSGSVGPSRFGDESHLARLTAQTSGITEHVLLQSRGMSPMAGIYRSLEAVDQPAHAASNAFWLQDLLATARHAGNTTLLTGQGGNATISWPGYPTSSILRARWRARGISGVVGYLAPTALHRRRAASVQRKDMWPTSAIKPSFARRMNLPELAAATIGSPQLPTRRAAPLRQRVGITQPGYSRVGDSWSLNSALTGIDVRDPTLDPRVIEASYSIPDRFFTGPQGQDRWVLRTAMAGLLPDEVRLNTTRGRQSADLIARVRLSGHEIDGALAEVSGGPAEEFVSLERLRSVWAAARLSDDPRTTHLTGTVLLRGIMAAVWLTRTYS